MVASRYPGRLPKSAGIPIAGALQREAAAETKPNLGKFAAFVLFVASSESYLRRLLPKCCQPVVESNRSAAEQMANVPISKSKIGNCAAWQS